MNFAVSKEEVEVVWEDVLLKTKVSGYKLSKSKVYLFKVPLTMCRPIDKGLFTNRVESTLNFHEELVLRLPGSPTYSQFKEYPQRIIFFSLRT